MGHMLVRAIWQQPIQCGPYHPDRARQAHVSPIPRDKSPTGAVERRVGAAVGGSRRRGLCSGVSGEQPVRRRAVLAPTGEAEM